MRNVVELSLESLARPPLAVGLRLIQIFGVGIAALDHEPWNHPMKDRAVIEAGFRQRDEIFNMLGGLLREEDDVHVAKLCFDNGLGTFRLFCFPRWRLVSSKKGTHTHQQTPTEHERHCHHFHYDSSLHHQPPWNNN